MLSKCSRATSYLEGDIEDINHCIGVVLKNADDCFLSAAEAGCVTQLLLVLSNEPPLTLRMSPALPWLARQQRDEQER